MYEGEVSIKSTYLIILFSLSFSLQLKPIFAQDSFNTESLFESAPTAGEYTLKLDSPKNGTYCNEVNIVWFSDSLNKFSLYYNIDNNSNWEVIEKEYTDSSEYWKNYNWKFQNINAEYVKIKVSSYLDTNIYLSFYHLTNDDIEELSKLLLLVKSKELILYLPDQTKDEF